jgi:hypothetical protein
MKPKPPEISSIFCHLLRSISIDASFAATADVVVYTFGDHAAILTSEIDLSEIHFALAALAVADHIWLLKHCLLH